ncbi:MAG: nucleotidyltransferase domain-containing protein [Candidatus Nanohaloarchaea archaeon]
MSLAAEEDIQDLVSELRDTFGRRIENILLFGSYARDEHALEGDIDILVLLKDEIKKRIEIR